MLSIMRPKRNKTYNEKKKRKQTTNNKQINSYEFVLMHFNTLTKRRHFLTIIFLNLFKTPFAKIHQLTKGYEYKMDSKSFENLCDCE